MNPLTAFLFVTLNRYSEAQRMKVLSMFYGALLVMTIVGFGIVLGMWLFGP